MIRLRGGRSRHRNLLGGFCVSAAKAVTNRHPGVYLFDLLKGNQE